jgi:predicted nuclease with TOPRIM domain
VAIFGGGTFVGEGLIDALGRNQTAFIPYGLDADASVRLTPSTARTPVRIVAVAKGMLLVEDQLVLTTRYHLTVGDRPPARLFLRHPRAGGYEPDKPGPDTEMSEEALLVPVAIGSGWQGDVSILERRNVRQQIPILGTEAARLVAYLAGSKLPAAAEKKLREMVQLRGEEDRLGHEIDSLRARLSDLAGRAAELRESLKTIEKTPRAAALQQKLLERLGEATKESEELSRKLSDDGASLNEARARLADGLRELVIEEEVAPAKP